MTIASATEKATDVEKANAERAQKHLDSVSGVASVLRAGKRKIVRHARIYREDWRNPRAAADATPAGISDLAVLINTNGQEEDVTLVKRANPVEDAPKCEDLLAARGNRRHMAIAEIVERRALPETDSRHLPTTEVFNPDEIRALVVETDDEDIISRLYIDISGKVMATSKISEAKACQILEDTGMPQDQIALAMGFKSRGVVQARLRLISMGHEVSDAIAAWEAVKASGDKEAVKAYEGIRFDTALINLMDKSYRAHVTGKPPAGKPLVEKDQWTNLWPELQETNGVDRVGKGRVQSDTLTKAEVEELRVKIIANCRDEVMRDAFGLLLDIVTRKAGTMALFRQRHLS